MSQLPASSLSDWSDTSSLGVRKADPSPSPSVAAYGPGPEGRRCGECANLCAVHVETKSGPVQTLYYCCIDGSARRVTWRACDRFVEAPLIRAISHQQTALCAGLRADD